MISFLSLYVDILITQYPAVMITVNCGFCCILKVKSVEI